ncbi:TM236 protein, partial [Polypterus senegalus]
MSSGKKFKYGMYELLQFSALCVPLFVVMQRFASIVTRVRKAQGQPVGDANTVYWLIVASSIAYVTSVALVIWFPMKYMIAKKKKCFRERKKWRPVLLAYMILCTLPCFAFLTAGSQVQVYNNTAPSLHDTLTELPVSLVIFSLIGVDIIEKLRKFHLRGQIQDDDDPVMLGPVLTHLTPVPTVSGQMRGSAEDDITREANGSVPRVLSVEHVERHRSSSEHSTHTASSTNYGTTYTSSGLLHCLTASDPRAVIFVESFVLWFDTVELVRVTTVLDVSVSGWLYPIYIFSYISLLRLVLKPRNPVLNSLGVLLQDIPFLFIRLGLVSVFGYITPLLFLFKNLLVSLTFVYFNFLTRLKMFNTERMF